jgi:DNA-nicking Smr family endonuclease
MSKLILDLHDIYNKGWKIDQALKDIIEEAISKKIPEIVIIPGKGSGQLKKKVLRFLAEPEIKKLYHRIEKDSKNFGKIYVYFKFKGLRE